MLAIDDLILQVPDQLGLGFESREIDRAWAKEGEYSHDGARWNAWLNRLCLEILVPRLAEESGNDARVWPSEADLPSIWEFVNGTAITLGNRRIVLIPSEAFDIEEFCVPKEWVDIPNWTANYYLAVQVDPDDCWLRVWGYVTHEMLKSKGIYNEFEGVYSLEREDVIEDLHVMWVAGQFCREEKSEVEPLAALSPERVESLLAQLSQPSLYSPRLDVDFQQWAALLENHTWRRQLYQRRLGKSEESVEKKLVNLSQWLQHRFTEGWQTIEEVFGTAEPSLAFAYGFREIQPENSEIIRNLIKWIYTSSDEDRIAVAAYRLGECGTGNPDAVAALSHLLRTTQDEEIRWTAAESLWMIDPGNPAAGVKRLIDVGMELAVHSVALMVATLIKPDRKMAILLRVYPMAGKMPGKTNYLQQGLELIVRDEAGHAVLKAQAREADNYIQLKLGGSLGEQFSVRVAYGNTGITEYFVI